jgi:hypothetical protein
MTKSVRNREQSERVSNQKRDPRTGRFTRAPQAWWCAEPPPPPLASFLTSHQASKGSLPISIAPGDQHSHLQNLRLNVSPCHCLGVF